MFNDLYIDFKVNHLRFANEANFNDAKILSILNSSIASVENVIKRSIIKKNITSYIQFNAGFANLNPIPNEGLVIINGKEFFSDEYGELFIGSRVNGRYRCEWISGFDNVNAIPADIKEAIFKLASHMFHYRGDAMNRNMISGSSRSIENINNPIVDSGASVLLTPYIQYVC
jgi:hypothetical protein